MPRNKGTKKTGGRRKGTPNRTTEEVRLLLLKLLSDNINTLKADIKKLEPKERANVLITLAKHVTPPALQPEKLTEEQLHQLYEYFLKQHKK